MRPLRRSSANPAVKGFFLLVRKKLLTAEIAEKKSENAEKCFGGEVYWNSRLTRGQAAEALMDAGCREFPGRLRAKSNKVFSELYVFNWNQQVRRKFPAEP